YIIFAKKGSKPVEQAPSPEPITVKGTVVDKNGTPLIGVSIVVEGTTLSTATDTEGNFTLTTDRGTMLSVSYVGYHGQRIQVTNTALLQIVLDEDTIVLGDVVVTALGIKKEAKSLSYHVQQVSGMDINRVSDANFVNNLNGRIAGATINSSAAGAGGSARVVMRGVKSIAGNNNVLYVIDGIPLPNLSSVQSDDIYEGAGQTGDGISNLNPDDIESLSVLSGPSAAALYGSAASNGVVIITTKRGQQERLSLTVSNSTSFSTPLLLPKFQNTYGQTEQGSYQSWGEKLATPSSYRPADFFQTAVNVSNAVSLSTGTEHNQTYVSVGTVNARGIIHNNNYDRYNFSARNTSLFLDDKMTMDIGFMTSFVTEQNMTSQGQYHNPLVPVYLFPPGDDFRKVEIYQRYDASRNLQTQFWPYNAGFSEQNPYWITEKERQINHKVRYMTNLSLKYEFADWINLAGRVRLDTDNERHEDKRDAGTSAPLFASVNGFYTLRQKDSRQIYGDVILNINRYFYDQRFNITAHIGTSIEDFAHDEDMYGGTLHGVANLFTYENIDIVRREQTGYRKNKQAVFASAQLGYKSMVYLDVTARNDWVSTLAQAESNSFFYPSIGLSGIITDIFDIRTDILPYAKLRVSYSEVGNEPEAYLTIPTYPMANGYPRTQTRMFNPNLAPELTKSWEAGLNLFLLKDRVKIDATVYKSSTYNQFFEPTLSASTGFTSVVVNAGQVDNKGIELSLSYQETIGKFHWSTFLTYSANQNKIIELLPGWTVPGTDNVVSLSELDMGGTGSYKMVLKEGGRMGDIYVNTLKTGEHGEIWVHPVDQIVYPDNNNFVYAGNSAPKYNAGWGGTFGWNGLSLDFLFTARVGGIVVSNTQAILDAYGVSQVSADARDAGGVIVNGRPIPVKEYYQTVGGGTSGIGAMYVYSATNVRLSELKLSYELPVTQWCNWLKGATVSAVGRNLFFLYNTAPFDPEVTANTGTYYQGIDYFMMPSTRSVGFSVKLHF
ncbi:MAG: SusC/RagA family TonB-linked outer membrane protein, partial [Prevotellaceae bacterium]|nr:SusC/RagA family TonB-linked outer membrane protein [Prevotellaceae bacterium]